VVSCRNRSRVVACVPFSARSAECATRGTQRTGPQCHQPVERAPFQDNATGFRNIITDLPTGRDSVSPITMVSGRLEKRTAEPESTSLTKRVCGGCWWMQTAKHTTSTSTGWKREIVQSGTQRAQFMVADPTISSTRDSRAFLEEILDGPAIPSFDGQRPARLAENLPGENSETPKGFRALRAERIGYHCTSNCLSLP
jgi:hypothetical protein